MAKRRAWPDRTEAHNVKRPRAEAMGSELGNLDAGVTKEELCKKLLTNRFQETF
jgi:hypothetical protein